MQLFRAFLIVALTALAVGTARAEPEVPKAPTPDWVQPTALPTVDAKADQSANDGIIHLLADLQRNETDQTTFEHYARRYISQSGVQENARLAFDFEPSYQKLTLHQLVIHRDGQVLDRLPTAKIRQLKREEELSQHLYNGHVTALIDVEDIRVGDTLEYAFSVQGSNPVFAGIYSDFFMTSWAAPVSRFSLRLLEPADQFLDFKSVGTPLAYSKTNAGGITEHRWTAENIPAAESDSDTPSWYSPFGWLQFSEYRNWAEVVAWAQAFYSLDSPLPPEVETKLKELRELPSPEARILGALNYAQNQFRYLSISEGVHSYRPYPIAEVIQRGFGDCKDKARLLTALLRSLGFTAHPALVQTRYRHEIGSWLPSPIDFDHVIVALEWNGRTYWLDPTRDHQRGQLADRYSPPYGKALIIRPGETALTDVSPAGESAAAIRIESIYEVPAYDQAASLKVRADYRGREADWMRQQLSSTSVAQLQKSYLNDTARLYPGVTAKQAPTFQDDVEMNQIISEEQYQIPELWQPDKTDKTNLYAEVYPYTIKSQVTEPDTRIRQSPIAVAHPKTIREIFILNLPEKGDFSTESFEVKDPAFEYFYRVRPEGKTLTIEYDYRSLDQVVPAERVGEYLENLKKARNNLGYSISLPRHLVTGEAVPNEFETTLNDFNWLLCFVVLLFLVVILPLTAALYFWRPDWPPQPAHPQFAGLRGWLILIAVGLLLRPFVSLASLADFAYLFQLASWNQFTQTSGEYYHPLWMPILFVEMFVILALIALSFLLIVLFFQRRRTFPPLFITLLAASALFTILDALAQLPIAQKYPSLEMESGLREVVQTLIQAAIWIPYALISERVKATFIR